MTEKELEDTGIQSHELENCSSLLLASGHPSDHAYWSVVMRFSLPKGPQFTVGCLLVDTTGFFLPFLFLFSFLPSFLSPFLPSLLPSSLL